MEENYTHYEEATPAGLTLSAEDIAYLRETQKWAKFLGILGFVFTGLMVVAGLGMSAFMSSAFSEEMAVPGPIITGFYVLLAVLYFFPSLYLYRYGSHLKVALAQRNNQLLTLAFRNEKSFFKFCGILMVIMLVFYGLMIVGFALFGMMAS